MNGINVVMEEAAKLGRQIDPALAEHVLWECTGWPMFWHVGVDGDTPEACLRAQARGALSGEPTPMERRLVDEHTRRIREVIELLCKVGESRLSFDDPEKALVPCALVAQANELATVLKGFESEVFEAKRRERG